MKKFLFFILFIISILLPNHLKASPYMGGEIFWECIPAGQNDAGKFIFYLRLYRDCNSINYGTNQTLSSTSPAGNIYLTLISGYPKDLTTGCNASAFSGVSFVDCNNQNPNGAVTEYLYKSNPVILNTVPPSFGWIFSISSCCRNPSNNTPFSSSGYRLQAKMYPYNNNNAYPCFDNSPQFVEPAEPIISGGYPAIISHNAFDMDLDSMVYEWGLPMQSFNIPVTYNTGYSYTHPLPGASQNSNNVAATIDSKSGFVHYESHTEGRYLMCIKISTFRCSQLISEQWREVLVGIKNQVNNSPPTFDIGLNINNTLIDTVYVGDTVSFPINISDIQFLPDGSSQKISFNAFSNMFGKYIPANGSNPATFSDSTGCTNPPCATLSPAPSSAIPVTDYLTSQIQFNWIVESSHYNSPIGCGVNSNIHYFFYKASDDYCPIPADNYVKHTIVVLPLPYEFSAEIKCINKLQNGDIELKWNPINDTTGRFMCYVIKSFDPISGNQVLDTIYNMGQNTYIHSFNSPYDTSLSYFIETKANFPNAYSTSHLIKAIDLFSIVYEPCKALLKWSNLSTSSDDIYYKILQKEENTSWLIVDSTTSLFYNVQNATDKGYYYKIQSEDVIIYDSLGNYSVKNSSSNIIEIPKILSIGNDTIICINHNISLYANNFYATVYQWSNGSTDSYLDIMASDLGLGSHQIWLDAINASGCVTSDTVIITIEPCTSLGEINDNINFKIRPNPSDGKFIVKFNNVIENYYYLEIIDMKGAVILKEEVLDKEFKIDLSGYPSGNYLLKIKSEGSYGQQLLILK